MNYYVQFMKYVPNDISKLIDTLIAKSEEMNIKLYLAGGMVRDFFLNVATIDIDIVVDGDHIEFVKAVKRDILKNEYIKFIYNEQLMTAVFNLEFCNLDIVQMRSEVYENSGALPKVIPDSLFKDCHRRDYTINSLYFELSKFNYKLIDMNFYLEDLKKGILKVHHDNTFNDDPTRIFRGIKYSNRLGFSFDEKSLYLAKKAISSNCFMNISHERLVKEVSQLLKEDKHISNIKKLCKLNIDLSILNVKINHDYSNYTDYILDDEENNILIYKWLEILYINRMIVPYDNLIRFTKNKQIIEFINLVYTMEELDDDFESLSFVDLISYIGRLTKEEVRFLLIRGSNGIRKNIEIWDTIKCYKMKYNGDYVKNAGILEGKTIGEVLKKYKNSVYKNVVDPKTNFNSNNEKLIIDEIISQEKNEWTIK